MKYENKNTRLLKKRLADKTTGTLNKGTESILSKVNNDRKEAQKTNGTAKPASLTRVLANKVGKVSGTGTDAQQKVIQDVEDKTNTAINKETVKDDPYKKKTLIELKKLAKLKDKKAIEAIKALKLAGV
jgi:hypothetical protein